MSDQDLVSQATNLLLDISLLEMQVELKKAQLEKVQAQLIAGLDQTPYPNNRRLEP